MLKLRSWPAKVAFLALSAFVLLYWWFILPTPPIVHVIGPQEVEQKKEAKEDQLNLAKDQPGKDAVDRKDKNDLETKPSVIAADNVAEVNTKFFRKLIANLAKEILTSDGNDAIPLPSSFSPGRPVPTVDVRKILLVTTYRTGSTFVGELLSSTPGTFFSFEPISILEAVDDYKKVPPDQNEALDLLRRVFSCDFPSSYVELAEKQPRDRGFLLNRNSRLWLSCYSVMASSGIKGETIKPCYDVNNLNEACSLFPVHVIKTTRMYLEEALKLKTKPNFEDLHVVYLVRDPRGVINSRASLFWCEGVCENPAELCQDMEKAAVAASSDPSVIVVRYEDLAMNPLEESTELLKSLGLPLTEELIRFLAKHTEEEGKAQREYSTFRKSKAQATAWKSSISPDLMTRVEEACGKAMQDFGYLSNAEHDEILLKPKEKVPILSRNS